MMRARHLFVDKATVPFCRAWVAERVHHRLLGLLLRPPLKIGEGLLLPGVRSVHTFHMKYALDLIFLDTEFRIAKLSEQVGPGQIAAGDRATRHVLEVQAGAVRRCSLSPGQKLHLEK